MSKFFGKVTKKFGANPLNENDALVAENEDFLRGGPALFAALSSLSGTALRVLSAEGSELKNVTYADLAAQAESLASTLKEHSVSAGSVCALAAPATPATVAYIVAVRAAGAALLPIDESLDEASITYILRRAGTDSLALPGESPFREKLRSAASHAGAELQLLEVDADGILVSVSVEELAVVAEEDTSAKAALTDTAYIVTSAVRQPPALLALSEHNVAVAADGFVFAYQLGENTVTALTAPLHDTQGLLILVLCLRSGGTVVLPPPPATPACDVSLLSSLLSRNKLSWLTLSVEQLKQLTEPTSATSIPSGLNFIRVCPGGLSSLEPIITMATNALQALILGAYGPAECFGVSTGNIPDDTMHGTLGRTIDTCDVAIFDQSTRRQLGPQMKGVVAVRGDCVPSEGYLNDEELNRQSTFIDVNGDSWLSTGDIGELDLEGYLIVSQTKAEDVSGSSTAAVAALIGSAAVGTAAAAAAGVLGAVALSGDDVNEARPASPPAGSAAVDEDALGGGDAALLAAAGAARTGPSGSATAEKPTIRSRADAEPVVEDVPLEPEELGVSPMDPQAQSFGETEAPEEGATGHSTADAEPIVEGVPSESVMGAAPLPAAVTSPFGDKVDVSDIADRTVEDEEPLEDGISAEAGEAAVPPAASRTSPFDDTAAPVAGTTGRSTDEAVPHDGDAAAQTEEAGLPLRTSPLGDTASPVAGTTSRSVDDAKPLEEDTAAPLPFVASRTSRSGDTLPPVSDTMSRSMEAAAPVDEDVSAARPQVPAPLLASRTSMFGERVTPVSGTTSRSVEDDELTEKDVATPTRAAPTPLEASRTNRFGETLAPLSGTTSRSAEFAEPIEEDVSAVKPQVPAPLGASRTSMFGETVKPEAYTTSRSVEDVEPIEQEVLSPTEKESTPLELSGTSPLGTKLAPVSDTTSRSVEEVEPADVSAVKPQVPAPLAASRTSMFGETVAPEAYTTSRSVKDVEPTEEDVRSPTEMEPTPLETSRTSRFGETVAPVPGTTSRSAEDVEPVEEDVSAVKPQVPAPLAASRTSMFGDTVTPEARTTSRSVEDAEPIEEKVLPEPEEEPVVSLTTPFGDDAVAPAAGTMSRSMEEEEPVVEDFRSPTERAPAPLAAPRTGIFGETIAPMTDTTSRSVEDAKPIMENVPAEAEKEPVTPPVTSPFGAAVAPALGTTSRSVEEAEQVVEDVPEEADEDVVPAEAEEEAAPLAVSWTTPFGDTVAPVSATASHAAVGEAEPIVEDVPLKEEELGVPATDPQARSFGETVAPVEAAASRSTAAAEPGVGDFSEKAPVPLAAVRTSPFGDSVAPAEDATSRSAEVVAPAAAQTSDLSTPAMQEPAIQSTEPPPTTERDSNVGSLRSAIPVATAVTGAGAGGAAAAYALRGDSSWRSASRDGGADGIVPVSERLVAVTSDTPDYTEQATAESARTKSRADEFEHYLPASTAEPLRREIEATDAATAALIASAVANDGNDYRSLLAGDNVRRQELLLSSLRDEARSRAMQREVMLATISSRNADTLREHVAGERIVAHGSEERLRYKIARSLALLSEAQQLDTSERRTAGECLVELARRQRSLEPKFTGSHESSILALSERLYHLPGESVNESTDAMYSAALGGASPSTPLELKMDEADAAAVIAAGSAADAGWSAAMATQRALEISAAIEAVARGSQDATEKSLEAMRRGSAAAAEDSMKDRSLDAADGMNGPSWRPIDLEDVDSAMTSHPSVEHAIAFTQGGPTARVPTLACAIKTKPGARVTEEWLNLHAQNLLPEHGVPSKWYWMEAVPPSASREELASSPDLVDFDILKQLSHQRSSARTVLAPLIAVARPGRAQ